MSISNILKATSITFKKYRKVLLPIILAMSLLLFTIYVGVSMLFNSGIAIIILMLVLFPMFVGLKNIARKCVLREDTVQKDFYFGFKNYFPSLKIEISTLAISFIVFLVGLYIGYAIFGLILQIYAMSKNPEIVDAFISLDLETYIELIGNFEVRDTWYIITVIVSVLLGSIALSLKGMNRQYICYISFDAPFTLLAATNMSKDFFKRNKKKTFQFNLIFFGLIAVVFCLSYIVNILISRLDVIALVGECVGSLIFFIITSFILMYYMLASYHSYNHYLRSNVLRKYEELKNKLNQDRNKENM